MASFAKISQAFDAHLYADDMTFQKLQELPYDELAHLLNGSIVRSKIHKLSAEEREYLAHVRQRIDDLDVLLMEQGGEEWRAVDEQLNVIYSRINQIIGHDFDLPQA